MKSLLLFVSVIILVFLFGCISLQARSSQENRNVPEAGINVKKEPEQLATPTSIRYFQPLSQNHWLIADSKSVYRTEDGGSTWALSYEATPETKLGQRIMGLSFVNERMGFLIVNNDLLYSEDGGVSWNRVGAIYGENEMCFFNSCYFVDAKHGWAVGGIWNHSKERIRNPGVFPYEGAVYATQDGGLTWQRQRLLWPERYFEGGSRWFIRDVFFIDTKKGWIAGDNTIFWTVDGGNTWHLSVAKRGSFVRIQFFNEKFGWATKKEKAEFAVSTDGGRHWKILDGPPAYGARRSDVLFITPNHGFATLVGLYETRNGGRTWMPLKSGAQNGNDAYSHIARARDGTLIALTLDTGELKQTTSTDNGLTWEVINQR